MCREIRVLAFQELGHGFSKVAALAPIAHVILPALPQPAALLVHIFLVYLDERALEQRNDNSEDGTFALGLLCRQLAMHAATTEQLQVGLVDHQSEEAVILVGKALVDRRFLDLAFLALLEREHLDGQRKTEHSDDIAEYRRPFK